MPKYDALSIPSMRIELDGEDVSRRWAISSLRATVSNTIPGWTVSIDVSDDDKFSVPKLGTLLTVSLGFGSEFPWSKILELEGISLSGLPNVFTITARESAGSQPNGIHAQAGSVPFEALLGGNIVTFKVSQTRKKTGQEGNCWEGTFDSTGAPNLSVGDAVTLVRFPPFLNEELKVSSISHCFDSSGFTTRFTVEGALKNSRAPC